MRRIVTNNELPHLWMHKAQFSGRNGAGSFFFEGDTIYSYGRHFPIARHVINKKTGKKAILFNTASYSHTTSAHQSRVRRAIPSDYTVFDVPFTSINSRSDHRKNIADYQRRISDNILRAARARSSWAIEDYLETANELTDELKQYCKFFGQRVPKLQRVPEPDTEKLTAIRKKEAEKKALADAAVKAKREAAAKKDAEEREQFIKDFREGRPVGYRYFINQLPTMLRIEGDDVVTSLGARVPVSHAARALKILRRVRERGETYQRNGHTIHLGHYALDSLSADGVLKAGCHNITWEEIERIAPELEKSIIT